MQDVYFGRSASTNGHGVLRSVGTGARDTRQHLPTGSADQQFIGMLDSFHGTGGIARAQELIELFRQRHGPDVAAIVAWIETRAVICFEWRAEIWLPWFQFNCRDLLPHPQLVPVLAELNAAFDPWETAGWFAAPNPWIAWRRPVDTLVADLPGVLHAARADRFIANG